MTTTSDVPAVKVPVLFRLLPTATVPKPSAEGDAPNCAGPRPVPIKGTFAGSAAPTTVMDSAPFTAPGVLGENTMLIVEDSPAARTIGKEAVVALKPAPVAET